MKNCINFIRRHEIYMKSEFRTFPSHITFPTPDNFVGNKKSVTEKVLSLYDRRKLTFLNSKTGLDWTSKTRTSKTPTSKTRATKTWTGTTIIVFISTIICVLSGYLGVQLDWRLICLF